MPSIIPLLCQTTNPQPLVLNFIQAISCNLHQEQECWCNVPMGKQFGMCQMAWYRVRQMAVHPKPQTVPVSRPRGDIIPPRSGINQLIPYIISPRCTLVLNPLPTLKWNAVPGASRYTVSLLADEDVIWQTDLRETFVAYSGKPPLESGVDRN